MTMASVIKTNPAIRAVLVGFSKQKHIIPLTRHEVIANKRNMNVLTGCTTIFQFIENNVFLIFLSILLTLLLYAIVLFDIKITSANNTESQLISIYSIILFSNNNYTFC